MVFAADRNTYGCQDNITCIIISTGAGVDFSLSIRFEKGEVASLRAATDATAPTKPMRLLLLLSLALLLIGVLYLVQ